MNTPKTLRQLAGLQTPTALMATKCALLLIDFQLEYYSGALPIPDGVAAAENAAKLVAWADRVGVHVIHVHHVAGHPKSPLFTPGGEQVVPHPLLVPSERHRRLTKGLPSSFVGTTLQATLQELAVDTLIVTGLVTHMCVSSTTRDALSLGYASIVAADACATRDLPDHSGTGTVSHRELHRHSLAALADRFAAVMDTQAILRLA